MYHTVLYHPCDYGIEAYEPGEPSTGWDTEGELLHSLYSAARESASTLYECGVDLLPHGVADIRGAILGGDPIRLYALCYYGQDGSLEVQYYGITTQSEAAVIV